MTIHDQVRVSVCSTVVHLMKSAGAASSRQVTYFHAVLACARYDFSAVELKGSDGELETVRLGDHTSADIPYLY